jgi:D-glycero-D-manno-heptose 1,7-bisphosphate phosphatase
LRAAREHGLDLAASFLIGDRGSDIAAGVRAGCRTVLIEGPASLEPPIVTVEPLDPAECRPDRACANLTAAVNWILEVS